MMQGTSGGMSWGVRALAHHPGRAYYVMHGCACPADTPRCHPPHLQTPPSTPEKVSPPGTMAPAARHTISRTPCYVMPSVLRSTLCGCPQHWSS